MTLDNRVAEAWSKVRSEAKSNPNFDKAILNFMKGPGGTLFADLIHAERYQMMEFAAKGQEKLHDLPMTPEKWIGAMAGIEHVAGLWGRMIVEVKKTAGGDI